MEELAAASGTLAPLLQSGGWVLLPPGESPRKHRIVGLRAPVGPVHRAAARPRKRNRLSSSPSCVRGAPPTVRLAARPGPLAAEVRNKDAGILKERVIKTDY